MSPDAQAAIQRLRENLERARANEPTGVFVGGYRDDLEAALNALDFDRPLREAADAYAAASRDYQGIADEMNALHGHESAEERETLRQRWDAIYVRWHGAHTALVSAAEREHVAAQRTDGGE